MASLQNIQDPIDQIPALLQEVRDLRPANPSAPFWQDLSSREDALRKLLSVGISM